MVLLFLKRFGIIETTVIIANFEHSSYQNFFLIVCFLPVLVLFFILHWILVTQPKGKNLVCPVSYSFQQPGRSQDFKK